MNAHKTRAAVRAGVRAAVRAAATAYGGDASDALALRRTTKSFASRRNLA